MGHTGMTRQKELYGLRCLQGTSVRHAAGTHQHCELQRTREAEFELSGIGCLVCENNSEKSSVLQALATTLLRPYATATKPVLLAASAS